MTGPRQENAGSAERLGGAETLDAQGVGGSQGREGPHAVGAGDGVNEGA
jgi:hypothetical protein